MKAVLEPNEILIHQVPNEECPSGYHYIVETSRKSGKTCFVVRYTLEEVVQWVYEFFEPKSAAKE